MHRSKNIGVNYRRYDTRCGPYAFRILGNRAVATRNYVSPLYQVISFTEPLQRLPEPSVGGASIGNVSSVIQIEDHGTSERSYGQPFNERRTE